MNMRNHFAQWTMRLLVLCMTVTAGQEMFVLHPHSLARRFDFNGKTNKGSVKASLGGFGHFDQQGIFMGRVHYPILNQDGCRKFNESDFDESHLQEASFDGHKAIIMVDRGNCHFVKKVQNIQKFGAIMAIVVDRDEVTRKHMKDDGQGSSVRIPSFMIGNHDGRIIKEAVHNMTVIELENAKKDMEELVANESIPQPDDPRRFRDWQNNDNSSREQYKQRGHQVIMQGVIGKKISKRDTVDVDLWYQSPYDLYHSGWNLKELAKMSDVFHQHVNVNFQPRTYFQDGRKNDHITDEKCGYGRKYCLDMGGHFDDAKKGEDGMYWYNLNAYSFNAQVHQAIKEQCVFDALKGRKSHWFRFMEILIDGCAVQKDPNSVYKVQYIEGSCFDKAMNFSQVFSNYDHQKYKQCYDEQIDNIYKMKDEEYESPRSFNFFDRDYKKRKDMSLHLLPSITVNGENFKGDYKNVNELFKMICSMIEDRPDECKSESLLQKKKDILEEFNKEHGEKDSPERAVTNFYEVRKKYQEEQDGKSVHERTTTKTDLVLVLVVFILATGVVFYCRNKREQTDQNQQMHDAVNAQVSQYFQMVSSQKDDSQN